MTTIFLAVMPTEVLTETANTHCTPSGPQYRYLKP